MNKKVLMYIIIAWAVLATVLACVFGVMLMPFENPNVDKDKVQQLNDKAKEDLDKLQESLDNLKGDSVESMPIVDFNNLEFEISVDGTSYAVKGISSKIGSLTKIDEIIIPSEYDGLPVTGIGNSAFSYVEVKKVKIPDSVTSIGIYSFAGCTSLTSIEIPDSVTSIGDNSFAGCTSLTNVEIPDSVTSIGSYSFAGCTSLTNVEIPDSVTSIGYYVFQYCSSLTNVEIPDSVTSIGYYAFQDCSSLTNIEIPNSITSIGSGAFSKCSSLTKIVIPNSVKNIGEWAFAYCFNLTINCEAKSQPSDWNDDWNPSNCPVVWDYKSE